MKKHYAIPKIIHFIWAGGSKLLPQQSIDTISKWSKLNKGFVINLWVDVSTADKSFEELIIEYTKLFGSKKVPVLSADQLGEYGGDFAPIIVCDISRELKVDCVAFEIDQLRPNYGASSDLLRYNILYLYGGAYFDSDVAPNPEQPLAKTLVFRGNDCHMLYIDHVSQKRDPGNGMLQNFSLQYLGNDTFICSKGNPLMLKIYNDALSKYKDASSSPNRVRHSIAHLSRDMREITIGRTGPVHVTQAIGRCNPTLHGKNVLLKVEQQEVLLCRVRDGLPIEDGGLSLTRPLPNTRNWLRIRVIDYQDDPQKAYALTMKAIKFEAETANILRLDDHVYYLSKSLQQDSAEVAKQLIKKIKETSILRNKNLFMQITFENKETIELFNMLNGQIGSSCQSIFNIDSNDMGYIIMLQTSCISLKNQLLNSVKCIQSVAQDSNALHSLTLYDIFNSQEADVLNRFVYQVQEGIVYVRNLLENFECFDQDQKSIICSCLFPKTGKMEATEESVQSLGVLQVFNQFCILFEKIDKIVIKPDIDACKGLVREVLAFKLKSASKEEQPAPSTKGGGNKMGGTSQNTSK